MSTVNSKKILVEDVKKTDSELLEEKKQKPKTARISKTPDFLEGKTTIEKFVYMQKLITDMEEDFDKHCLNKVKKAGTRCRVDLLKVKKICDSIRKDIMEAQKAMSKQSRQQTQPAK